MIAAAATAAIAVVTTATVTVVQHLFFSIYTYLRHKWLMKRFGCSKVKNQRTMPKLLSGLLKKSSIYLVNVDEKEKPSTLDL